MLRLTLILGGLALLLWNGFSSLDYPWQWYRVPRAFGTWSHGNFSIGPLLEGLLTTLNIVGSSLILALLIGLLSAGLRLSPSPVGRALARTYLETIRNTPLLVQLFCVYFLLAPIFELGALPSAILALALFEGAYMSEIMRAGITSIEPGQHEAAASLGMHPVRRYWHIVLPQALRRILPPLTGQSISLIKDSALVSTIAIADLSMQGRTLIAESFLTFEIWFSVAGIYLCLTLSLSALARLLENRLHANVPVYRFSLRQPRTRRTT